MVKWMTIVFGAVPLLVWFVSVLHGGGDELLLVALPFLPIVDLIANTHWLNRHSDACTNLCWLVLTILYALAGYLLGRCVRLCATWTRKPK